MSALEVPDRAYRAAELRLASYPELSNTAVLDAVAAAAPVVVAAELRRMALGPRVPGRAAMMMRAAALDPEGAGR